MKQDKEEKHIIELIKQLPKVTDEKNKAHYLLNIPSHKKKKKRFIPILSIAITIGILFLLYPVIINSTFFKKDEFSSEEMNEVAILSDYDDEMEQNESSSSADDKYESIFSHSFDSYVVHETEDEAIIVHGAIADEQAQFVIPLSLIASNEAEANVYYESLDDYIMEEQLGVGEYLFKNVSFTINESEKTAIMKLPNNFSIISGTQAYIFEQMVAVMFEPEQIEKVILKSTKDQPIDLGPIGKLNEVLLEKTAKTPYKIIHSLTNYKFLVPIILTDELTILEALNDMKKADETLGFYETIPEDIQFSIDKDDGKLFFIFKDGTIIEDSQTHMTMVEAILMTAKSYGFHSVSFKNSPLEQIGRYNLSEPIHVPKAVNPID